METIHYGWNENPPSNGYLAVSLKSCPTVVKVERHDLSIQLFNCGVLFNNASAVQYASLVTNAIPYFVKKTVQKSTISHIYKQLYLPNQELSKTQISIQTCKEEDRKQEKRRTNYNQIFTQQ